MKGTPLVLMCEIKRGEALPYCVVTTAQTPREAQAMERLWGTIVQSVKAPATPREAPRERQP
jgi:hypothetical protein